MALPTPNFASARRNEDRETSDGRSLPLTSLLAADLRTTPKEASIRPRGFAADVIRNTSSPSALGERRCRSEMKRRKYEKPRINLDGSCNLLAPTLARMRTRGNRQKSENHVLDSLGVETSDVLFSV